MLEMQGGGRKHGDTDVNPILTHTSAPSTFGLAEPTDQDHGPTGGCVQALSKPPRPALWFLKMRTQRLCEAVTFPAEHGGRHCARERSGGRSSLHAVLSSSLQPRVGCIILSPRQGRGRRCRESQNVPKSVKLLVGSSTMLFQAALVQGSVLPRVLARASTRSWIP